MKTRDLIAALQEADPSGEIEVSVGNQDIHFIQSYPAYYDGCQQVLKRDSNEREFYNIIGAEIRGSGLKIKIHTLSIEHMFLDNPDAPVTFDGDYAREHYAEKVAEWRKKYRQMKNDAARGK